MSRGPRPERRPLTGSTGRKEDGADQPPARERLDRQALWHSQMLGDQAMTLATIDRLVHHATILEMNVESYRRKEALDRKRSRGRPPAHATPKELEHPPD